MQLSPSLLGQRDQRVAASAYLELLAEGVRLTGDEQLGLHLGEAIRPGYYGVLGYLIMSCATLSDALHRQARYASAISVASNWTKNLRAGAWNRRWCTAGIRRYRSISACTPRKRWPAG